MAAVLLFLSIATVLTYLYLRPPTQAPTRAVVITPNPATTSRKPSSTTALPADRELTMSAPALPADRELTKSAAALPADQELTEVGSIAFNTPQHVVVGEPK